MARYLLDSNIISHILAKDPIATARLERSFQCDDILILSPVVFYEIRRGLLRRKVAAKTREFERLMLSLVWDDLQEGDWETASRLWADSVTKGNPRKDADILIAAHAIGSRATLVTDNEKHFLHLGVPIENWRKP